MPVEGNLRRLGFTGENLPDWHSEGACAGSEGLDWYGETPEEIAAVKDVCAGCPIQVTCLQDAIDRREAWGVWGGLDEQERAEYAKRLGAEAPTIARHGERARYVGTKNVPGCRCDLCRRAHATYEHERRLIAADRERSGWTPPTKACEGCGQQFAGRTDRQKFCTAECSRAVVVARMEARQRDIDARKAEREARRAARLARRCPCCDELVPLSRTLYCSKPCAAEAERARHNRRCSACKRSLPAGRDRYCSQECAKRGGQHQKQTHRVAERQAVAA